MMMLVVLTDAKPSHVPLQSLLLTLLELHQFLLTKPSNHFEFDSYLIRGSGRAPQIQLLLPAAIEQFLLLFVVVPLPFFFGVGRIGMPVLPTVW